MDATILRDAYLDCIKAAPARRSLNIKIAFTRRQTSLRQIAKRIGISHVLVTFILSGKHKGYEHRAAIARALGLAESVVFPDGGAKAKRRRAA